VPAFRLTAAALALVFAAPFASPALVRAAVAPSQVQAASAPVLAASGSGYKVVLIVGPMGAMQTQRNRGQANQVASQAASLGATVVKVYSPNATYAKVRAAVANANIIVYWGHGSGYPNPYSSTFRPDRANGWGLNTTTTHGDADSWANHTLVYCGEKALQGQLTSASGADQRKYCSAGRIHPAPGFVMVYVGSCYTAGQNENGRPAASTSLAKSHLAYYSRPMVGALGAGGYFAGRTWSIVTDLLAHPGQSFGNIYNAHMPGNVTAVVNVPHLFLSGKREWLTRQPGDPYWFYAFAGNPARTLSGGTAPFHNPTLP
jgi:hypothetical protein